MFAREKEKSNLGHYKKKYFKHKKKVMLQKIIIFSKKKIQIIPFLYEKMYVITLKNPQSNFYFHQRASLE